MRNRMKPCGIVALAAAIIIGLLMAACPHHGGSGGGSVINEGNFSGSWPTEITGSKIPKEIVFGDAKVCVPFYNDHFAFIPKTAYIPLAALYPSGGASAVLKKGSVFEVTLPQTPPAPAYLKSKAEMFPSTEGTFTGQVCWVSMFKTTEKYEKDDKGDDTEYKDYWQIFWEYATKEDLVEGKLVFHI